MSWHFSQALEVEFSGADCSDGERSAPSKSMPTADAFSCNDRTTGFSIRFQSGMMSRPSTGTPGLDRWILSREGCLVRTSVAQAKAPESKGSAAGSGPKWHASSARFDLDSRSWKTAHCLWEEVLPWSSVTLPRWGTMRRGELWERTTPALPTSGTGFGFWPTPVASEHADCGTNWESLKRLDKGGRIQRRMATLGLPETLLTSKAALNPNWVEWLMGWPIGWTACEPLAMDKFRQWCDSHGTFFLSNQELPHDP